MDKVCDFLGARCGNLNFVDPRSVIVSEVQASSSTDPEHTRRYRDGYAHNPVSCNPRAPILLAMNKGDLLADCEKWSRFVGQSFRFYK